MISIFIIEDDRNLQELYLLLLQEHFQEVIRIASNGLEAIEKYKNFSEKPEVIIMDHRMPLMDGMQAMLEILKIDPNASIIFVSADSAVEKTAVLKGAELFICKPMNIQHLIEAINKVLIRKKSESSKVSSSKKLGENQLN
ncbi:MAG: response regulator [Candidatus Lokiarchaeota archaeon]|nr:response regulator [Candidatus Lokiarchaeota archaeon]MBD3202408.1 response regulator [Candidatus Lokiarchaeota archaeon]